MVWVFQSRSTAWRSSSNQGCGFTKKGEGTGRPFAASPFRSVTISHSCHGGPGTQQSPLRWIHPSPTFAASKRRGHRGSAGKRPARHSYSGILNKLVQFRSPSSEPLKLSCTLESPGGKGNKSQCWPHPHIILLALSLGKRVESPQVRMCSQGGGLPITALLPPTPLPPQ